jgi:hypothetical protein
MLRFPTPVFAPDVPTTPAATAAPSTPSEPSVSTPSPAPAAPASGTPSPDVASPSEGGVDPSSFEFMFGPEGGDPLEGPGLSPPGTVTPEPVAVQPAPAQPATPVVTAPEPVKPATPIATPAPTETTSPVTPSASPNLDPYDPGTLAAHLAQNEEQVVQHLAESMFKLSDKDVEELESNTVATIPRLLARTAVVMQRNFLMQMANIVPRMVQAHGEVTKRHSEAEGEFYTRWPDLKKDQHGTLVMQYAAVYRQMHPEASRKDMIEAVGPMAMMAAKVIPSVPGQPSPSVTNGSRPPQPAPFVPAGPSAGGASMSTAPELSPIEAMFRGQEE